MSRPGFVLDVDRSTPPISLWSGDRLVSERLPPGSRVLYAPEPDAPLVDADVAIRRALESPIDVDPLDSQLRPGMKLTIAFDDLSVPSPGMPSPDNRQRVITQVLSIAAEKGVDDVVLLVARGLRRRLDNNELTQMLGERIVDSFAPQQLLIQHDAEAEDLVPLESTSLIINRRVAESDLLIYVGIEDIEARLSNGIVSNIASTATIRSLLDDSTDAVSRAERALNETIKTFYIATTTNNALYPPPLRFLQRRENEWTSRDLMQFKVTKHSFGLAPSRLRREMNRLTGSARAMTGVFAGTPAAARKQAAAASLEQCVVDVDGQTDVLSMGVPAYSPLAANSTVNPLLVAFSALSTYSQSSADAPVVRDGGALIVHHPTPSEFHPVHQPASIDFFERILPDVSDEQEERFATDRWYAHLYRTSYAHHGVVPFLLWKSCASALQRLAGVVVVGGDVDAVHRLGFRRASTFADALEMARDITGNPQPSITHMHTPPTVVARVR